jgi:hypothetical protein
MRAPLAVVVSSVTFAACLVSFPTDPVPADAAVHDATANVGRYQAAVMADRPILYLRLGEASGRAAKDEIGAGQFSYRTQGVAYGLAGALAGDPDTAIALDSLGGIQMQPGAEFTGKAPFSVEVWFKSAANNTQEYAFVVDHQTYAGPRRGWALEASNKELRLERWNDGHGDAVIGASPGADGVWHHLVGTYDTNVLALYLDGVPFPTTESTAPIEAPIAIGYLVGGQNCNDCKTNGYVGALDELAIYDKVLPVDRMRAHREAAR